MRTLWFVFENLKTSNGFDNCVTINTGGHWDVLLGVGEDKVHDVDVELLGQDELLDLVVWGV